ncbi:ATP-binding protein [Sulfurimonas sp.]|uniref:sensor histidine kinase n=1 Tax=Sulfurimonas sp. TaxID=2022749 RepID=UPI002613D766|nr:ATP-binding protein [Sulfurimonas sp.]MCW8896349.1 ATP-binding protein [Sulfurimonas sp.]
MKERFNNFLTSGFTFDEFQMDLKSRYLMVNIGILLSTVGLIYGIVGNILRDTKEFVPVELAVLFMNFMLILLLRKDRKFFEPVVIILTTQFTFLFLFLIYIAEPEAMKHTWLFTYPILLLYLQDNKKGLIWIIFLVFMLLIAPFQNFIEVKYSLDQLTYLSVVLILVHTIIYFYQVKIDEAKFKILEQQALLRNFNNKLEDQVHAKTAELRELNESLESKVQDKVEQLIQKDKLLTAQSKQAVMGEMISMIAHQWRQPLSTITLQIANLQFKKLLGDGIKSEDIDDALSEISDTIMYLSDTVDDFQTYFHPDKEIVEIEIHELLQKAVNFATSRLTDINVEIDVNDKIFVKTYMNEFIQVILNILNNAIDAHNDTKLQNPFIKLYVKDEEAEISVIIKDNAGGIKEENLNKLFEPYFSTKGKNGTGLGLYMSQMIIQKQFNGKIDVKTSENFTTVIIKVPKNIS